MTQQQRFSRSINPLYAYLQDIGRIPLLRKEEEIQYGRQIQQMLKYQKVQQTLTETFGHEPSLEAWAADLEVTVDELEFAIKTGQTAKRKMVEANLRLVVNIAKQYQNRNVDLLDLIQEGAVGLQRGVEKFDPSRGYKFSTYAYWWIRQAITRTISQQSRTIRLPIHVVEMLNKIKRSQRELSQRLGRIATIEEVATELDLTPKKVQQYLDYSRRPISLEKRIGEHADTELHDMLEDESACPNTHIEKITLNQDMATAIEQLPITLRKIIIMRFGLNGRAPLSLSEVGRRLGMSRERVRQLQQKAYQLIRQQHSSIQHYLVS